jgi:hypothetical protein
LAGMEKRKPSVKMKRTIRYTNIGKTWCWWWWWWK